MHARWKSKRNSKAGEQHRESKEPDCIQEEPLLVRENLCKSRRVNSLSVLASGNSYSLNSLSHQHCEFLTQMNLCLHLGVSVSGKCPLSLFNPCITANSWSSKNWPASLLLDTESQSLIPSVWFLDKYCLVLPQLSVIQKEQSSNSLGASSAFRLLHN